MKKMVPVIIILLFLSITIFRYGLHSDQTKQAKTTQTKSEVRADDEETGIKVGQMAPNFKLKTSNDDSISLQDYRGKKVLLNFWATWCPPCRAEIPEMRSFYEQKPENVEILAVNVTQAEKDPQKIVDFLTKYDVKFPVLYDKDATVSTTYMAVTIPTSYFIDSTGKIVYKHVGPLNKQQITQFFQQMK